MQVAVVSRRKNISRNLNCAAVHSSDVGSKVQRPLQTLLWHMQAHKGIQLFAMEKLNLNLDLVKKCQITTALQVLHITELRKKKVVKKCALALDAGSAQRAPAQCTLWTGRNNMKKNHFERVQNCPGVELEVSRESIFVFKF